jgi:hypothetical protein
MRSISASCSVNPLSNAGRKCASVISAKGGSAKGSVLAEKNGFVMQPA